MKGSVNTAAGMSRRGKSGRSAAVSTAVTPGSARAAAVSTPRRVPAATGAPTSTACSTPSGRWSAANVALPVSLAAASTRVAITGHRLR